MEGPFWHVIGATFALVVLAGCSGTSHFVAYPDVALPARDSGCSVVTTGELTPVPRACTRVADWMHREAPLALFCSRKEFYELAGERACEVGATLVRVRFVDGCYAARAEFYACPLEVSIHLQGSRPALLQSGDDPG